MLLLLLLPLLVVLLLVPVPTLVLASAGAGAGAGFKNAEPSPLRCCTTIQVRKEGWGVGLANFMPRASLRYGMTTCRHATPTAALRLTMRPTGKLGWAGDML